MAFFGFGKKEKDKMKTGLEKTRTGFWGNILNTLTGSVIDDDMYDELEEQLILADVGGEVAVRLVDKLRDRVHEKGLKTGEEAADALRDIIAEEMTPDAYKIKRDIGVIFQEVAVFEELTVYENIDYFCGLYVKDKQERKKDIEDAIALVGLDEFRKYYPKQLSGGLLRRLNIACGIAHKPKLIFLDEPTVAVDPQSRNNILDGIRKLRDDGATICYTTHYMEEVVGADKVIVMDKGKVVMQGTPREIFSQVGKLKEYRLDVPQVTILADLLRQSGLDIPLGVLTREELVGHILRIAQIDS